MGNQFFWPKYQEGSVTHLFGAITEPERGHESGKMSVIEWRGKTLAVTSPSKSTHELRCVTLRVDHQKMASLLI